MNFFEKIIKYFYIGIAILVCLNFFVWKEVFYLSQIHDLKVNFFDVGQGDSAFIITPQNHQILIDGGPSSDVLQKLAEQTPFWDRTLDLVILSHPEKDHMQGLTDVLQRYKANNILWTGVKKQDAEYKKWLEVLIKQQKMGAKIITAQKGQEIKAGKVLFDILYPFENLFGKELKDSSNDSGVVAKLIYGKNSFLFTGDISLVGEKELVEKCSALLNNKCRELASDVLKVAHHGSKYSSSDIFLQAVCPKFAVIEVGKNSYGHPTPETLQRLEIFGIKVIRTDQSGDVLMSSDGNSLKLLKY